MGKILKLLFGAFITVNCAFVVADNKKISNYELKPLYNSSFTKDNPNILPYEKCFLVGSENSSTLNSIEIRSLIVGDDLVDSVLISLFCYSKALKLAFKIPVDIKKSVFIGPGISFLSDKESYIRLRKLDGLMFGDVLGKYRGLSVSAPFMGGSVLWHKGNKAFLTLGALLSSVFVSSVGYKKLYLVERPLSLGEVYSNLYLSEIINIKDLHDKSLISEDEASRRIESLALWPQDKKYRKSFFYQAAHIKSSSKNVKLRSNINKINLKDLVFKKVTYEDIMSYGTYEGSSSSKS